jgi:cytochrome c-type biogenesis protein CcmH/NrfG
MSSASNRWHPPCISIVRMAAWHGPHVTVDVPLGMEKESKNGASEARWKPIQVYSMAGTCLLLGLLLGYLFRSSGSPGSSPQPATAQPAFVHPASAGASNGTVQSMPTLEQMQEMANEQAAPLLAKLKGDPTNVGLLNQIGTIYRSTHQFKEGAAYYEKALQVEPNNVAARTDMASCLFYQGDVDGALEQLQRALHYDPKDANSLFDLGMIRWQGKNDAKGAVAAWEQLLKSNPTLPEARRAEVKKLIARVKQ